MKKNEGSYKGQNAIAGQPHNMDVPKSGMRQTGFEKPGTKRPKVPGRPGWSNNKPAR